MLYQRCVKAFFTNSDSSQRDISVHVDGVDDRSGLHPVKSLIIGGPGVYVPFPSHSFLTPVGPTVWVLMLDCRCVRYNLRVYASLMLDLSGRNED
jgi:hypothetical protein